MSTRRSIADWLAWQQRLHPSVIELGLGRVRDVYEALGRPGERALTVVVAGTNGKGSTVAYLDAMLRASGLLTGTYVSPHLVRYNERIRIDGEEIGDEALVDAFERVEAARGEAALTYFEFGTLAALVALERAGCEARVLEIGLGGRLDAVNVIDGDASIVCSIGLDHMDWLGPDRDHIGAEKAGVFRPGRPAVVGEPDPPGALLRHGWRIGTDLRRIGVDFSAAEELGCWHYEGRDAVHRALPRPAMPGVFQLRNAASAITALAALEGRFSLARDAIERALREVVVPGRAERLEHGGCIWTFDVAHNPQAAEALAAVLRAQPTAGRRIAVLGMLSTKAPATVARELADLVDHWICVRTEAEKAVPAATLADALAAEGLGSVETAGDVVSGCERARTLAGRGDEVLVLGSFHTVGPARAWLGLC